MKGNTVKILLVGNRYTGKGQVGRAWGRTSADLPTLQPVILYERMVGERRIVAWVMSYDPEFEDIRTCFLKDADGIVFTFNMERGKAWTVDHIEPLMKEYTGVAGPLPPSALLGFLLDPDAVVDDQVMETAKKLAEKHGLAGPFTSNHANAVEFQESVDTCFRTLLAKIDEAREQEKE